jgi:ubiquinone/menaquinone biosynthesis C-methylase UbiE
MPSQDKEFVGSIPEIYDRLLVPLIFEPYARDVAARVAMANPQSVLEIAAGTGAVTRALVSSLPAKTTIVATDLNAPMLEHAQSAMPSKGSVEWKVADAQQLPFGDASFDAVVCQFGAMFFPDKVGAFREARRVLKPNGRYYVSVWDKIETNEFADVVTRALEPMFPNDPPRFLARTPHGHHDTDELQRRLKEAGFKSVAVEAVEARSKAASPREPAVAYVTGTPLRGEILSRNPNGLEEATERATKAMTERFGKGAVDGLIRAYVLIANS